MGDPERGRHAQASSSGFGRRDRLPRRWPIVGPAALRHVGPAAAALAAQRLGGDAFTRSTAESRPVRSSVTPAATAALSPVSAISSTTPDPSRALSSSISAAQVLARDAGEHLREERHARRSRSASGASRRPPPIASSRRSSRDLVRLSALRSSTSARMRSASSSGRALQHRRGLGQRGLAGGEMRRAPPAPVSASIRRTPARRRALADELEQRRCRRCARTCVPPHSSSE